MIDGSMREVRKEVITMAGRKKAVGYVCDVPVTEEGVVISKNDQRIRILKCAQQEGYELTAIYEDDRFTEDFMGRPGVKKLLSPDNVFEVLLVERIWSLSRKMKDLKPFLDRIDQKKATVVCTSCLWDCTSQQVRHRYMEPLAAKARREASARAAVKRRKKAA